MVARPRRRPTLTFDAANALCREFLPAGEAVFDYMSALQRSGFSAFVPHYEAIESFCRTPEDCAIHKQCLIEQAKMVLGRPWPLTLRIRIGTEEDKRLYMSPFIEQLCRERDEENGEPVGQLSTKYPTEIWRTEIDPCRKAMAYASIENKQAYDARWKAVLDEQVRRFRLETEQHATELAKSYAFFDRQVRYAFFQAVMAREAGALGFHHDRRKSRSGFPVFSMAIGEDWSLCWALEERRTFYWSLSEGRFDPYLEIRNSQLAGSIEKGEHGEFLFLRYDEIVPGFKRAYWKFSSFVELETIVKAHLCLYSLMAPILQRGLKKILRA